MGFTCQSRLTHASMRYLANSKISAAPGRTNGHRSNAKDAGKTCREVSFMDMGTNALFVGLTSVRLSEVKS